MPISPRAEIAVYVFFYRNGPLAASQDIYIPVMAGNALQTGRTSFTGDDTAENISAKNNYYSELTGIYWVWKNTHHPVTGACHYRRFFTCYRLSWIQRVTQWLRHPLSGKKYNGLIYCSSNSHFRRHILNEREINNILEEFDAILPVRRSFRYSIEEHYKRYHNIEDLQKLRSVISRIYPEYLESFDKTMKSKDFYGNNMFILKRDRFESFMGWWFGILFEYEKTVDLLQYSGYQERILGFLAERLLTVWFRHQNLKVKELPVLYFHNLKPARHA